MADHTYAERVQFIWDHFPKHRGKHLALWAKEGKDRKERARRWEAIEVYAHHHAVTAAEKGQMRRWRMFHALRVWAGGVAKRIRRRIHKHQHHPQNPSGGLGGVNVSSTAAGDPHWGGGGDVMVQFVIPFMARRGLGWSSHKRTPAQNAAVGGSPSSDHLTTHTTTDAYDFPTYAGEDDARALALAMGITTWSMNSYTSHYVSIDGRSWRVQILWGAAIGHGDHVHVGIGQA